MNPEEVKAVRIPLLSQELQQKVALCFKQSHAAVIQSRDLYARAESRLLDALKLSDWQPPLPLAYTSTCSAAFAAGRLDAEHFQPQYDALLAHLERMGDFRLADRLSEPLRRGISPDYVEEDGDVLVINSRHVGTTHVEVENNRFTSSALLQPGRGDVRQGDVLLNSTGRETIGRCQCLLEDVRAVADNHVAVIRPASGLDPVYLACFLNTLPGQKQTERGWTGSSGQTELRPDVVEDYRIWDAPPEVQQSVREAVESSHASRRRAKYLLSAARRAVEAAIEEGEGAGLAILEAAEEEAR